MKTEYQLGPATIILEGRGQCPADVSDDVVVKLTIRFPFELPSEICFGSRVRILEEPLSRGWGHINASSKEHRFRTQDFYGKTWEEAKAKAVSTVKKEAGKLIAAIDARHNALVSAGEWE